MEEQQGPGGQARPPRRPRTGGWLASQRMWKGGVIATIVLLPMLFWATYLILLYVPTTLDGLASNGDIFREVIAVTGATAITIIELFILWLAFKREQVRWYRLSRAIREVGGIDPSRLEGIQDTIDEWFYHERPRDR